MRISDPITAKARLMQDGPHQLAKSLVRGHHPDALTPVASRESRLGMACTRHPAADLRECYRRAADPASALGGTPQQCAHIGVAGGAEDVERCGV
jgi:hypothetical protein